jgi:hypothetical protein
MQRMDGDWKNRVNLHVLIAGRDWRNYGMHILSLKDSTHDDLNRVLTELGCKRFKSKKKAEKIHNHPRCCRQSHYHLN